ncbi:MAG: FmdB family transcriptional regulator [Dehalococcoidales bacterium]|nr:MAG: FmdB family transcriptional regulator [Dehalococcoidales bacterium]
MPTYEYECNLCHHRFDKRQGFNDAPLAECPKCQGTSRRVFYPAPIIFKGSGFYVTDSRSRGGDGDRESNAKSDSGGEKSSAGEGAKETGSEGTAATG